MLVVVLSFVIYLIARFRRAKQGDGEKLAEKGYALLREDDPDGALHVAAQLEETGYSARFEIAALAHAAKGELERAVEVLQRGVEEAPTVYLLWQLVGNYLSDLGRYEEAEAAYSTKVWRGEHGLAPLHLRRQMVTTPSRNGAQRVQKIKIENEVTHALSRN